MKKRLLIYDLDFGSFFQTLRLKDKQYFYDALNLINSLGLDTEVIPFLEEIPDTVGLMNIKVFCEEGVGGILCFYGYDDLIIVAVGFFHLEGKIPEQSLTRAHVLREQYFLTE